MTDSISKRFKILEAIGIAVGACTNLEPKTYLPNDIAIRLACNAIQALIPHDQHSKLNRPKDTEERYKTPFSRNVALVLAWLNLLNEHFSSNQTNDDESATVKRSVAGAIEICQLSLELQIGRDIEFQIGQPSH
jgi:hypothetical protein